MGRKLKSKLQSSPGMTAEVEVQSDWRNQRRNIVAVIAPAALFQLLFLPFHTHTHSLLVPRDGHFLWGRGLGGGEDFEVVVLIYETCLGIWLLTAVVLTQ